MNEAQIRSVEKNDFQNVYPLFEQLWPTKILNKTELNKVFDRGVDSETDQFLCATINDALIGFCAYAVVNNLWQEGYISYIYALVVDEQYRGHGIGTALIREVMKLSKECGYKRVELDSGFPRVQAHKFYENLGFEKRAFLFSLPL
ncbi:MAG TPA: GNAT family N-acetyltransferase [Bacteroidota bacterium]|nr:GNAT family N-acetyltransferase [Bacteroidota bacterium]